MSVPVGDREIGGLPSASATELLVAVAIFLMSGKSEKKKKKKKDNSETTSQPDRNIVYSDVNPQ